MKNQKRWALLFFLSPVLLWLVVLIVLPHIDLLIMSFRIETDDGRMAWSLNNYLSFLKNPSIGLPLCEPPFTPSWSLS